MKTLAELAKSIYNSRNLPHVLAEHHITCATMYSQISDEWVEIQLKKADFWQAKDFEDRAYPVQEGTRIIQANEKIRREKPLSDKAVEMMWLNTKEGEKELRVKFVLKSLEKMMAAIKSSLVKKTLKVSF
jgi:hypothetical protein